MNRRDKFLVAGALVLAAAGVAARVFMLLTTARFAEDAYVYLTLAQSLLRFEYTLGTEPHVRYLILYPLSIAVVHLLSLKTIDLAGSARLLGFTAALAIPALTYLVARGFRLSRGRAAAAALILLLDPVNIIHSGDILSEPFFTVWALLSLVGVQRRRPVLAGAALALAALTRYEGVLLFPLLLAFRDQRRGLAAGLAAVAVLYGPWLAYILVHLGRFVAFSYPLEMVGMLKRTWLRFIFMPQMYGYYLPMVAGIAGLVLERKRFGLALAFPFAYIIIHMTWHWNMPRFWIPLLPFIWCGGLALLEGDRGWLAGNRRAWARNLSLGYMVFFLVFSASVVDSTRTALAQDPDREAALEARNFFRPPEPVLANINVLLFRWHTGADCIRWLGPNANFLDQDTTKQPVDSTWVQNDLGRDPHEYVARHYLNDGCRLLIVNFQKEADWKLFGFLADAPPRFYPALVDGKTYRVRYQPLKYLNQGGAAVVFYSIMVEPG